MCINQWSLQNDLTKYGLNPAEWSLRELSEQRFKIVHVEDQNFYFVGETRRSGFTRRWAKIKLISY